MTGINDFILGWLSFMNEMNPDKFISFFWYFIYIEFGRYIALDFFVVLKRKIRRNLNIRKRNKAREQLFLENPLISVIAPGKNEGKNIRKLSDSLSLQTYKNYELIIVDDGSDDDSKIILEGLLKEKKINKFLSNPIRGGKASAANAAMLFCNGKYTIHLDADSYLDKTSIENIIIPFYMEKNVGAVGGDVRVNNIEETLATSLQGIEYLKTITLGRLVASELGIMRIISGAYGAFLTKGLKNIGNWDVGPGLDGDITIKFRKMGYRILFEETSICYTNSPLYFKNLGKQRFRWDRSLVRFRLRKHSNVYKHNKGFNLMTFITLIDGVLYNFVFNYLWWIYLFSLIFITVPNNFIYIILTNYILYIISNLLQFLIIVWNQYDTFRKKDWYLFLYLPLMPLYSGIFLRLVRTYAQVMELLFKVSYDDPWNPWKVSKVVKEKEL